MDPAPANIGVGILGVLGVLITAVFAYLQFRDTSKFSSIEERLKDAKDQLAEVKLTLKTTQADLLLANKHIADCLTEKAVYLAEVSHMKGERTYILKEVAELRDAVRTLSQQKQTQPRKG